MQNSYIPKASIWEYCEGLNLCSVRKDESWVVKLWVKDLSWNISEQVLETIINSDTYNWKTIVRVYSSGHIFLDEKREKVFLVTTQKNWKTQHQFTWWSPLEDENKEVIFQEKWVYKFDISKVRNNARIRTKNRTWVDVVEEYNQKPLVDWALMENEENWEVYYKLVCLMHFIVKKYDWTLSFTWNEDTIWCKWYDIDKLPDTKNIAPNAYVVSKRASDMLSKKDKVVIISDFSKTLTSKDNPTTWSVFAKSWLLWDDYTNERNRYFDEYHQFELQWNVEKTVDWWCKHLELFVKYWLNKNLVERITKDKKYFSPREWLAELFAYINKNNIDFFIVSSGVSDFINSFLKSNDIDSNSIKIYWNEITYDDKNKVIWFDRSSIITTINKNNHDIDLEYYQKVILLWDDESDLDMYKWECLKIWFCDESVVWYDIYLWKSWSIEDVVNILKSI